MRQRFVDDLENYRTNVKPASIDGFVDEVSTYSEYGDVRNEFIRIAKYAIVFHILDYEGIYKSSKVNDYSNCWIEELARFINEKVIEKSQYHLKIVTFNYDRTLEHQLYNHYLFSDKKEEIKAFIER